MKSPFRLALRFLFAFIVILTLFTDTTSADISDEETISDNIFRATTLDFSNRSTINSTPSVILFRTTGLIAGGFDVASVRVKKDGRINFPYHLSVQAPPDSPLCQSLELKVIKDNKFIYQDKLVGLDLDQSLSDQTDDYIFILSLPSDTNSLSNQTCQFDFVFVSSRSGQSTPAGFSDEERVTNFISTGSW